MNADFSRNQEFVRNRVSTQRWFSQNWAWMAVWLAGLLSASGAPYPKKLGDLDNDGKATVLDIVLLVNLINGSAATPSFLRPFADLNGDGAVNEADVHLLAEAVLELKTLPDVPDTDADGLLDPIEILLVLDPLKKDSDGNGVADGSEDADKDGLPNVF